MLNLNKIFLTKDEPSIITQPMPNEKKYFETVDVINYPSFYGSANLFKMPPLNKEQEYHMFRRMNYYKSLFNKDGAYLNEAVSDRNIITEANMRLMIPVIRKNFKKIDDDIISYMSLIIIRCTEYFDFRKEIKFSTYVVNCMKRDIWRYGKENKIKTENLKCDIPKKESEDCSIATKLPELIKRLPKREKDVISRYYGIDVPKETTKQIGSSYKLSGQMIRVIRIKGLDLLRKKLNTLIIE